MIQTAPHVPDPAPSPSFWSLEGAVEVPTARLELRRYQLPCPSELWELDSAPIFSAVAPRPEGTHGEVRFGDSARPIRLGRLMLRPAGVPMHSRGDGGALTILACRFDPALFTRAVPLDDWDEDRLRRCAAIESRGVAEAAARLRAELRAPGFAAPLAIEALVQLLAVEIGRVFQPGVETRATRGGLAGWQMRRIEERLSETDGGWPSTAELAQLCGISRSHLSRAFVATTGMTLAAFAAQLRVERAMLLLRQQDLPIGEIAARLGFASASAFGAAFRRATASTPGDIRRASR